METTADGAARQVRGSTAVHALARLGIASRGLVWLVLALLAGSLALGRGAQADQDGALRALRDTPVGGPLLVALVAGFAGYAVWCGLQAWVGHRDEDGATRLRHRATAGLRGLVYAALCVSTGRFLVAGSSGGSAQSRTAAVLGAPGGRLLVGVVGVVVVLLGLLLAGRGLVAEHAERLEGYRVPDGLHGPAVVVGAVGYVGRGLVLSLVGAFLLRAALTADPDDAKGLDAALQAVAGQPYGRVLLAAAVVALLAYALWSFVEATYRDLGD